MNILIVGTGYAGLVTGACFADLGVNVTCVDSDARKINLLLYGGLPIYEQGLEDMVKRSVEAQRLNFTSNFSTVFDDVDYVFCTVDTPPAQDGSTDLTQVVDTATRFARQIKKYSVFIIKSTVPLGTCKKVKDLIKKILDEREVDFDFDVVSNPDFLTEGNAIKNFMKPDRIILGVENDRSRKAMDTLYHPLKFKYFPVIYTDPTTAEMIKYAATSMLATRVSFMNEIANLCELVGADINTVRHGVGTDSRIGSKYIYPGCGYGGTLFPKDINDLINIGEENCYSMEVLKAVDKVNTKQKRRLFEKFSDFFAGEIAGKTVALWGLSFKPDTDDIRQSPAINTIDLLLQAGCHVRVFDPVAMNAIKFRWNDIYCALDIYDAVNKADAVMLVTEWRQFRVPAWDRVKQLMRTPLVIDGRNIYDADELTAMGFKYTCIGKSPS
ncbi:MAG: UDP-glucose/GDP-mannose dehydrogenase family protein [Muribaculaceae bacterium]|nr:UDP-glucose/GDP-mannose dehydrogenase family protein [Muribaculaceae bacterium]